VLYKAYFLHAKDDLAYKGKDNFWTKHRVVYLYKERNMFHSEGRQVEFEKRTG